MNPHDERRRFERYETEAEIYFHVGYDLETKVEFQLIDEQERPQPPKYIATSKNISCDGISFVSKEKLGKGETVYMEVYLPGGEKPVILVGEVRWSGPFPEEPKKYETGLRLIEIGGHSVIDSIYFDEEYQLMWSDVLESVLGGFRKFVQENNIQKKNRRK